MNRAWAEVNLDAIAHNARAIKALLKPETKLLAVIKADGYGHGSYEVAQTLLQNGADYLGVATMEEALELRARDIGAPILILGHSTDMAAQELVNHDITPNVFQYSLAKAISDAAVRAGKQAKIHISLDTGMSRTGFNILEKDAETILAISKLPNIEIEGIFTHFAKADEVDRSYTDWQFAQFMKMVDYLEAHGLTIPIKHVCNSAGVIEYPEYHLDMVRPGICLYGHYPSEEVDKSKLALIPAMELKSVVTRLDDKEAGVHVSYGGTYQTQKTLTKIATVPVGYADGYPRNLSNKAEMLVGGQRVPLIGRICMDQCMIDVTSVDNIAVGDAIILFGKRGDAEINATELASLMGTISYELLCGIGKRIPRVYLKDGKIVNVLSYLT